MSCTEENRSESNQSTMKAYNSKFLCKLLSTVPGLRDLTIVIDASLALLVFVPQAV